MDNGSLKRKNLKFSDVNTLSQDLNSNYNPGLYAELGFWYSMDTILKTYAKLPLNYKIHALMEHGVILTEFAEGAFRVHECLPSIVSSKYRVNILKKEKNFKGAYAIGPYIHYAQPLLSNNQLKIEKERLGKTLLVFPSHSTAAYLSKFDYEGFCNDIKRYSEDFDSTLVCLYYQDIQLNKHKIYQKNGFEVVTAGHANDNYFMPRLRSIIELSDMVMANDIGSQLGYCIYLKKPYFLDSNYSYEVDPTDTSAKLLKKNENAKKIYNLFSNFNEKINKEQYDLISYLWGFGEVKSSEELKKLILNINQDFSLIKYYISRLALLKSKLL